MGKKSKTSRKGKKAWRANISTEEIEDFFEKSTKDALSGGSLQAVDNDSLFFEDKSKDLAVKKKIEKHREKVLRVDSVLQKNQFVVPVPSSTLKKSSKNRKAAPKSLGINQDSHKDDSMVDSDVFDMWGDKDEDNKKAKKKSKPAHIPAVEVDPPGCSFNPTHESHQDTLATAVAEEMIKVYKNELGPEPVPLTVPGEAISEEDMYFLDVDDENDDESDNENEGGDASENKPIKKKKVTRVVLNKRARHREQLRKEAEAKRLKNFSKEIDSIPKIFAEIKNEDEEKKRRLLRRQTAKQEKLKVCPPRIGKHKFQPAPTQVLLSEEITGSIRRLKGCCTLIKDRYKSLEKRGLIVPKPRRNG